MSSNTIPPLSAMSFNLVKVDLIFPDLTYQSWPIVNLFNFCVFYPILIRFGLVANIGLRTTWNEFWITVAILRPTGPANQRRPIANVFNLYVVVQFGWNLVCGLLPPCYSPAHFMLLLCSYPTPPLLQLLPSPCRTPTLLLSSSYPAHS